MRLNKDLVNKEPTSDSQDFPVSLSMFRKCTTGRQQGARKHMARHKGQLYQHAQEGYCNRFKYSTDRSFSWPSWHACLPVRIPACPQSCTS